MVDDFAPWDAILDDVGDARGRFEQLYAGGSPKTLQDGTGGSFLAYQAYQAARESNAAFNVGKGTFRHLLDEKTSAVAATDNLAKLDAALLNLLELGVRWLEDVRRRTGEL